MIGADETAGELHDRLAPLGADLMARALQAIEDVDSHLHAAGGGRRHLREEDREGRDADRLGAPAGGDPQPNSRPLAVSRRLVRNAVRRGKRRARQGPALDAADGSGSPGAILSLDPLVVACGDGAVTLIELAARRQEARRRRLEYSCAGRGLRSGSQFVSLDRNRAAFSMPAPG